MMGEIIQGHVLEVLGGLPENSVDCCITSPPYWGLRDYKIEPQVWDENHGPCEHQWGDEIHGKGITGGLGASETFMAGSGLTPETVKAKKLAQSHDGGHYSFCQLCGAWRGSLGLEPTPELFCQHIVQVFREVRRVLKPSGVCFVNLGDSYAASQYGSGGGWAKAPAVDGIMRNDRSLMNPVKLDHGLKPKDLCGIPWRVAFALQADGWWLRSDIIWAKPNPMPESVTDRPTKSHEYIFLLTKSAKYFWNQEAIKEECNEQNIGRCRGTDSKVPDGSTDFLRTRAGLKNGQGRRYATRNTRTVWEYDEEECKTTVYMDSGNPNFEKSEGATLFRTISPKFEVVMDTMDEQLWAWWLDFFVKRVGKTDEEYTAKDRRNLRRFRIRQKGIPTDVIKIATEPTPEAHFATFPQELVKRCILAGTSEKGCCPTCGKPWEPVVEKGESMWEQRKARGEPMRHGLEANQRTAVCGAKSMSGPELAAWKELHPDTVTGWRPTCSCGEEKTVPAVVLDPFMGSGTTGIVAENLYRRWIGIELNPEYIAIAEKRLKAKANVDQANWLKGGEAT